MRLLFDKSFMQPDDMVELLRHRGLEIDLADNTLRKKIAARFGLTVPVFTSWITVVTLTRNACCHHARVWNKENAISPMIPRRLSDRWIVSNVSPKRIYYNICIIRWFIDIVSPNNDMLEHLQALLAEYPKIDIRAMGFPSVNWQDEPLWSTRWRKQGLPKKKKEPPTHNLCITWIYTSYIQEWLLHQMHSFCFLWM